jgi:hypothetical protein
VHRSQSPPVVVTAKQVASLDALSEAAVLAVGVG